METVLLTNCGTSFEADVIKSVLDGAGIPCMIVDHRHVAMWSFQGPDTMRPVTMPLRKQPSRKLLKRLLHLNRWMKTSDISLILFITN